MDLGWVGEVGSEVVGDVIALEGVRVCRRELAVVELQGIVMLRYGLNYFEYELTDREDQMR